MAAFLTLGGAPPGCHSQDTPPPPAVESLPKIFEGPGIKPAGFYFIDKNGEPIFISGMSFEQLDRASDIEAGVVQPQKPYAFERIEVQGTVRVAEKADLDISMRLNLAAPTNKWIQIPLRMQGFSLSRPPDIEGVENYLTDYDPANGGHVLLVKTDQPKTIDIRLGTTTRALRDSGSEIEFDLPNAATKVTFSLPGENLEATVVGSSYEVVQTEAADAGQSKVTVECNGGKFALRWRERDGRNPNEQVLEADSRVRVLWDNQGAPPTIEVDMDVSNRRGNLIPFVVQLPIDAELNEPLPSQAGVDVTVRDAAAGTLLVTPAENEQSSSAKFRLEYRLPAKNYDADDPLQIAAVTIPQAVRQEGELEIRTERNLRLRWNQNPAMRSAWQNATVDGPDNRVYLFNYDRTPFELEVWLTNKQQPLRVEQDYSVTVAQSSATIEGQIRASGQLVTGLPLVIDTSGWQTVEIIDLENERAIAAPFAENPNLIELELGELATAMNGSVGVRWKAARDITVNSDTPTIQFPLPRILLQEEQSVLLDAPQLSLQTEEGLALIPDLVGTKNLDRVPRASTDPLIDVSSLYRVKRIVDPSIFRGFLTESPPELAIGVLVDLEADANVLRIRNRWQLTPDGDLRGRLPFENITTDGLIQFQSTRENLTEQPVDESTEEASSQPGNRAAPLWQVNVNGKPALLQLDPEGRNGDSVIFSDELNDQPCVIEISGQIIVADSNAQISQRVAPQVLQVRLPRPALPGNEFSGQTAVRSIEAPGLSLTVSQPGTTNADQVDLADSAMIEIAIAAREERTTIAPRIEQALIRTEIGRLRRFDRFVALVRGNDAQFVIPFAQSDNLLTNIDGRFSDYIVRVEVDGESLTDVQVTRQAITIPLDDSNQNRLLDVRIWSPLEGSGVGSLVRPLIQLPINAGQTYWDVVLRRDRHLVWNGPGTNEQMRWQLNRLFLQRRADLSYAELLNGLGAKRPQESSSGNRYLLVSSDPSAFQIFEVGRPLLWVCVSGFAIFLAGLVSYVPAVRHPLLAIILACLITGLGWIAADLAVIVGQLTLIAMVVVALMVGIKALLRRRPRTTILGGAADGSSVRSAVEPPRASSGVDPQTTQVRDPTPGPSAAGAQS